MIARQRLKDSAQPMTNPLDEFESQLPGRLLTVELLVTILASRDPKAKVILEAVDKLIAEIESDTLARIETADERRGLTVFAVARESLDHIRRRIGTG